MLHIAQMPNIIRGQPPEALELSQELMGNIDYE
jgi:hypothetical protein